MEGVEGKEKGRGAGEIFGKMERGFARVGMEEEEQRRRNNKLTANDGMPGSSSPVRRPLCTDLQLPESI